MSKKDEFKLLHTLHVDQETGIGLRYCPFCGYEKPKFTMKRSGTYSRSGDMVQVLCGRCKGRGPIVTGKYDKQEINRLPRNKYSRCYTDGSNLKALQQKAADLWNKRSDD